MKELEVVYIAYYDPNTHEYVQLQKEANPELWNVISQKAEGDFVSDSSNWNPNV